MQIKKPSTLSVGVVVGSGVRWQSGVFISFFIFAFYYHHHHHHHHHHQRNALALVDVAPTYTKRASHGQRKVTYVRFPYSTLKYLPPCCSQQSCLLQKTCINGNPQLVKPCIQSFRRSKRSTHDTLSLQP